MRNIQFLIIITFFLAFKSSYAQSLIMLDEGINTDQTWDVPVQLQGRQGCFSIATLFSSSSANGGKKLTHGSLCNNNSDSTNFADFGNSIAEYQNRKRFYEFGVFPPYSEEILLRRTILQVERGEHGNWVSNAAYDFDKTIVHRPWVIFGIDRFNQSDTRYVAQFRDGNSQELAGERILNALNEIAYSDGSSSSNSPYNESADLGAVNISLSAGESGTSDLRCGDINNHGQRAVDILNSRGIAVVVALQNTDVSSNRKTWPACLNNVIKVGGKDASRHTEVRQIGVGQNGGIDFFAKDSTNNNLPANSYAAPRVAAAYAKLHAIFPQSSVSEKTDALTFASRTTDSYRTRLVNGSLFTYTAPRITKSNLGDAIQYLGGLLFSNTVEIVDINNIPLDDTNEYGPLYNDTNQWMALLNFDNIQTFTASTISSLTTYRAGTGILSSRRDIEIKFDVRATQNDSSDAIDLIINGEIVESFANLSNSSSDDRSVIVNRNLLNDSGSNLIELRPSDSTFQWGVKNIQLDFLPIIPLGLGIENIGIYGYRYNPTRFTGLRSSFILDKVSNNYSLSITGWDIDTINETEVFINGNLLGNLNISNNNSYGAPSVFDINSDYLSIGINYLELVQREPEESVWFGFDDEKWAVKDILIGTGNTLLAPIYMLLLEDED